MSNDYPRRTSPSVRHPLTRIRAQYGWWYQRVAEIIAIRARDLGITSMATGRQKVWRWEHRGVTPDRVSQRALALELGVPEQNVTVRPWPAWLADVAAPMSGAEEVAALREQLTGALRRLDELAEDCPGSTCRPA